MGFGWLKAVGKIALKVLPVASNALPFGGVLSKVIPLVIKGATGLHTVPAVVKYFPSLTPGQLSSVEHALIGVGSRVVPGFMVGMYFQNDDFRAGFDQCIEATAAVFTGWLP